MNTIGERVLIFDLFGRLVYGHPRALKNSRLSLGQEISRAYPEAQALFQEVMLTGRSRLGMRLESDRGELMLDVHPMRHPDQPKGVVCLLHGPEDREELLGFKRLSEDLRTIIESSYDGLWICDSEANVLQINRASERLNNYTAAEVIGRNMKDLVAEGYFDHSITLEVLERRAPVTRVQSTRTGRRLLSTGNPVFDENGNIIMVVTNDRDLSELDRLREEILTKTALSQRYQDELIDRQVESLVQEDIIFRSAAMSRVVETAIRVARVDSTVLITGPSGSGKEKIAELIHRRSPRAEGFMVKVNCGAVPETLFESELFGYEPGAFTGAQKQGKPGLVELADQGTLFLDEVAEIPLASQVKLLRFLDDGLVFRVGSTRDRQADVRVIAATNQDLEEMVRARRFREDLYYRLRVIPIHVPPLKERREDIPALIEHYVRRFCRDFDLERSLSPQALDRLLAHDFPGNVRELVNICERLVVMSQGDRIGPEDLPLSLALPVAASSPEIDQAAGLRETMALFEKALLVEAIRRHRTQEEVARALGVNQSTIARKMRRHNLAFSPPEE